MRPSGARTLVKYKVTRPPKRRPSYVYKKKKQIYIYLNLSKTLGVPRFNVVYIFYRITFSYILLFTKKRMQKSDNLIQKKKIKKKSMMSALKDTEACIMTKHKKKTTNVYKKHSDGGMQVVNSSPVTR